MLQQESCELRDTLVPDADRCCQIGISVLVQAHLSCCYRAIILHAHSDFVVVRILNDTKGERSRHCCGCKHDSPGSLPQDQLVS